MKLRIMTTGCCLCAMTACLPVYGQNQKQDTYETDQQSTQAKSDQQQSDARQMIDQYDENGDGMLQRSELPQNMRRNFSQLDRDKSGDLSASELRQHSRKMQSNTVPVEVVCVWVSDVDRGRLSLDDLQTAYDTLQDLDENNDGQISRNELQRRRQEIASRWSKQVVKRLDQDNDGQVDQEEARDSFLARQFDHVDRNGDGNISRQELQRSIASSQQNEQSGTRSAQRSQEQAR